MKDCVCIVFHSRIIILVQQVIVDQFLNRLQCQIWIYRTGSVAKQRGKMMDFSRLSALQDQSYGSPFLCLNQMLVHGRYRKQRRNRHMVFIHSPVRQDNDICSVPVSTVCFHKQAVQRLFKGCIFIINDRKLRNLEAFCLHILDLQQICVRENRIVDFQHLAVLRFLFQNISVFSDINRGRSHKFFPDRVDRRIGYLCKQLFKVIKQRLMLL